MSQSPGDVHFPHSKASSPNNYKHFQKCNFTAGLCLQGMKWLCEMPMGSMACFFRQAEYKCEDFLFFYPAEDIWPPQINEFPNYIACQLFKGITEPQVYKPLCLALPANWESSFSSKQEGVHVCQGERKSSQNQVLSSQ